MLSSPEKRPDVWPIPHPYDRGLSHAELGDHSEALDDFTEAIRLRPDYPGAFLYRGNSHSLSGNHSKAIDDYNEAIRLQPYYAEAFYYRGSSYSDVGDY